MPRLRCRLRQLYTVMVVTTIVEITATTVPAPSHILIHAAAGISTLLMITRCFDALRNIEREADREEFARRALRQISGD